MAALRLLLSTAPSWSAPCRSEVGDTYRLAGLRHGVTDLSYLVA